MLCCDGQCRAVPGSAGGELASDCWCLGPGLLCRLTRGVLVCSRVCVRRAADATGADGDNSPAAGGGRVGRAVEGWGASSPTPTARGGAARAAAPLTSKGSGRYSSRMVAVDRAAAGVATTRLAFDRAVGERDGAVAAAVLEACVLEEVRRVCVHALCVGLFERVRAYPPRPRPLS
jgi:hypothetical protein